MDVFDADLEADFFKCLGESRTVSRCCRERREALTARALAIEQAAMKEKINNPAFILFCSISRCDVRLVCIQCENLFSQIVMRSAFNQKLNQRSLLHVSALNH